MYVDKKKNFIYNSLIQSKKKKIILQFTLSLIYH